MFFPLSVAKLFVSLVDKKIFTSNEILGRSPRSKGFCRMGSENRVILGDTLSRPDCRGKESEYPV